MSRLSTRWRIKKIERKKNSICQSPIQTKGTPRAALRKKRRCTKEKSLTMSPIKRSRRRSLRLRKEPPRNHKIFEHLFKLKEEKRPLVKSRFKSQSLSESGKRVLRKLGRQGGTTSLFSEAMYGGVCCVVCGSPEDDDKMILCDGCDKGFHLFCLRPQLAAVPVSESWFCSDCAKSRPSCCGEQQDVSKEFLETRDYFVKNHQELMEYLKMKSLEEKPLDLKERWLLVGGKKAEKRRVNFRAQRSENDFNRRVLQLASLAAALKVKNIEYVTELQYTLRPSERHNSVRRESMQNMSRSNVQIFEAREKMRERGYCAPIMIEYDSNQGFVAVADAKILDRTLICEYVGEVGLLKNFLHDDCDSIMDLIRTEFPQTSLIITPKRKSNMARFLSGINNTSETSKRTQNVRSLRFAINGRAHVLLYAARDIAKGERLAYDYNALDKSGYPTEHFT